jgi:hypothetical protein
MASLKFGGYINEQDFGIKSAGDKLNPKFSK